MYSEDWRQKDIFHIKEGMGLRLSLVVVRDVVEEVAEVVGIWKYGGLVWRCFGGFFRMLLKFSPKVSETVCLKVWFGITDDSSGFL